MRWILGALAAGLAALGGFGLTKADEGLQIRQTTVQGVPLREVRSTGSAEPQPGVVVAHGFAGSARLMAGFGDSLARRGFVVVLLDFNGHGANTLTPADLMSNLDTAVGHLRTLPGVDPQRLSLIGHSMGAGAVTRYASTHPEISSTVAISLPNASELPVDRPSRLLLLVGAAEFPGFLEAARTAAQASPQRRLVEIPGVEHISILYSPRAHGEILTWLDAPGGPAPAPANRALAGLALLTAFGLAFSPLARLLLGPAGEENPHAPNRFGLLWAAAACSVAAVVAAIAPTGWMPIAVTNYVVAFTAAAGLTLIVAQSRRSARIAARPGEPRPNTASPEQSQQSRRSAPIAAQPGEPRPNTASPEQSVLAPPRRPVRLWIAFSILGVYALIAIAIPLHLGVTHALVVWPRWWLLALTVAAFSVFGYAVIRLCGGGFWRTAAAFAIAIVVLTAAAMTGLAPGFLLLVLPLFAVLMAWQAGWMAALNRLAAPAWPTAVVGAILPALPAAVTLPLT